MSTVENIDIKFRANFAALDTAMSKVKTLGSGIDQMGQSMTNLGVKLTASVTAPIAGIAMFGLKYNSTMQDLQTSFKVMLGSQEKALAMTDKLKKMGAATPFETSQLADYTKTLLSFGYTGDNVLPILSKLGDISLGNSEKMSSLTRTMGQINSLGKLQGGDLNQLIGQGWNPLNEIMKKTGETTEQVRKRMEEGKVTYKEVEGALGSATSKGGTFYKGMEEGSKTLSGMLSTLKDNASNLAGQLTRPIFDKLMAIMPKVNDLMTKLSDSFSKLTPHTQNMILIFGSIAAAVGPIAIIFGLLMSKIGIAVTAFGIIGGAIIPIIAGLSEFIPVILAIGVVMAPIIIIIMAMGAAFTYILVKAGALDVISVLFKGMVNGVKQGITTFKSVIKAGGDPITAFTTALKRIVPPELLPAVKALETAFAPLKQGIITFNSVIKDGGTPITAFTTALKRILPPEVLGLLTPLQPIIDRLSFSFGKFTSMIKAGASPIFALKVMIKDWIPPQTIKLIENLASTFIKLIESGVKYAIKYFNLILIVVKDVMSVLQPFGEKLIKSIIPPLLQIASQIQEFGTIFFKTMSEKLSIVIAIWKAMFPWLKLIIVPILDAVITIIKNLFNQLKNIFDVALGILTGDWSRVWKGLKNIVKDGLSTVTGVITTMLDGIGRLFVELASKAITWGGNIISGIIDGITGMVGKLKDTVSGIATAIKDFFPNSPAKTGALTTLPSWGRNISSMLAEGMLANKSKVATAAGAVSKIISKYLGWHSPTELGAGSDSDKWAPNLMKMFTAGLKKAIPGVSAACKAITDAISDKFYKAPTSIQKFFDDVRTTINDNVTSLKDVAKGKLNDLASAVTDALKNKSQGEYDKASQSTQWSIDAAEKAYAAYELQLNNEAEARYAAGSDARAFEDELIKARLADKKNELDKLKAMQEIELAQLKRDYDEKQKQAEDFDTINYYMMDNHQNDLITLLISYNSDWYKAGMSFADKLIAGFTSNDPAYYIKAILTNTVKTISSTFEDTMSISASSIESQVDEIQNKMQAGVDKMKANSTSYKSISTGTASTQSKIDALNKQIAALKKKTTTTTTTKGTGSDLGLSQYNDLIAKASKTYGVPEALIRAVMKQESGGNAKAVSSAGAQGLMQLMPGTARGLGVTNSFDPTQNVMGGTKYLSQMLSQFGGNTNKAIQAYNAGPAGNFNNSETQNYLKMVTGYMQQAGGSSNNTTTTTNTAVVKQIKDLQAQVANYKSQITKSPSTLASLVKANEAIGAQLGLVKSNGSWFIPGQSTALFAKGGIVTRPTNAIIGEGNEPEGVFPLSKLEKFITISQQSGLSPSVIINNDGLFRGANLTIRDDRDIRKLADEVSKQMQKTKNSRVRGGL